MYRIKNAASKPVRQEKGFTLLEVLVALVITGMAAAVFFQILSSGMRLEFDSAKRTRDIVNLNQTFNKVLVSDIRKPEFKKEGETVGGSWSLRIEQVETDKVCNYSRDALNVRSELYRYVFEYRTEGGREWVLMRYVQHEPDFFDLEFKAKHFSQSGRK